MTKIERKRLLNGEFERNARGAIMTYSPSDAEVLRLLQAKKSKLQELLACMSKEIIRLRDVEERNIVLEMRVNTMLNNGINRRVSS